MMVLGYRPELKTRKKLTSWDYMLAGGASSAATRALCQPLDVLKIRLQLQVESGAAAKYRSLPQTATAILREEGIIAFWKGHLPAQALSITYGVVQFASFEAFTKAMYLASGGKGAAPKADGLVGAGTHFVAGAGAGVCATLVSYPFDIVRTRLVAQGNRKVYRGTVHAATSMLAADGPRSLFRGIVPTFWTIAPYSGLQFAFYSFFSRLLMPRQSDQTVSYNSSGWSSVSKLLSGGLAGLCAKAAVYPFDTTKKRLQVAGFDAGRLGMGKTGSYRGMIHCLRETVRGEGLRGLFKGLSPGLIKAVATTSINFSLYELCVDALCWSRR
jgi:solute carrier family 25 thiamine pyrophosphate transporter 19